jgi:hypothetical protein
MEPCIEMPADPIMKVRGGPPRRIPFQKIYGITDSLPGHNLGSGAAATQTAGATSKTLSHHLDSQRRPRHGQVGPFPISRPISGDAKFRFAQPPRVHSAMLWRPY